MAVVENKTQQSDDQFVKEKEAAFLEFIQSKGLKCRCSSACAVTSPWRNCSAR